MCICCGKVRVAGPRLLNGSILLPAASDPLTAPTVTAPFANAWGVTRPPVVDLDNDVRPSPPTHTFRNFVAALASGVATYNLKVAPLNVTVCEIRLSVAVLAERQPWAPVVVLTQMTSNLLLFWLGGSAHENATGTFAGWVMVRSSFGSPSNCAT